MPRHGGFQPGAYHCIFRVSQTPVTALPPYPEVPLEHSSRHSPTQQEVPLL